ncbi:hypothetical protein [Pleionea sp. CnH1-48]|uniref:hypothetical protein n=1 Tax=Pleionea sp. CnH1-48 TaxID=2954494 RepID=UPI002096C895|nr:hypothetical protein [Pleionea sp. CnH1-48]MCO7223006.1 hypothetical protein [Pleionea sp. CnH1-48]
MTYTKIIMASVALLISSVASANSLWCNGTVFNSYVSSSGDLIIRGSWRNDYTRLCNLQGSVHGIDAVTCSMWSSYIAASMTNAKKVIVYYGNANGAECNSLPTYAATPAPGYVMLTAENG